MQVFICYGRCESDDKVNMLQRHTPWKIIGSRSECLQVFIWRTASKNMANTSYIPGRPYHQFVSLQCSMVHPPWPHRSCPVSWYWSLWPWGLGVAGAYGGRHERRCLSTPWQRWVAWCGGVAWSGIDFMSLREKPFISLKFRKFIVSRSSVKRCSRARGQEKKTDLRKHVKKRLYRHNRD